MQDIQMRYGEGDVTLNLAGAARVEVLAGVPPADIEDVGAALRAGLQAPAYGAPLAQLVGREDAITIIISDITRLWMRQDLVCTALVEYLLDVLQIPAAGVTVLVALGTHRPLSEEELQRVAGAAYSRVRVVNHDALAESVCIGTTSFGTQVRVNPLAGPGHKVILIGGTVHHLMSGYGGGRKSILPGVAAKSTIIQNHLRCLDEKEEHSSALIGPGKLCGNPVHLDMMAAAAFVQPVFAINVIGGQKLPCRLICGQWEQSFLESYRLVNDYFGVPITRKADVVIASCGGFPKDINLYQGVKTLLNAGQALREGGTLVMLARCQEGGGAPDFFDWIRPLRAGRLDAALRADFSIAGYIFYASIETIRRAGRVLLLCEIPPADIDGMGVEVFSDAAALQQALALGGKEVYLMPAGGATVPYLAKE